MFSVPAGARCLGGRTFRFASADSDTTCDCPLSEDAVQEGVQEQNQFRLHLMPGASLTASTGLSSRQEHCAHQSQIQGLQQGGSHLCKASSSCALSILER